MKPVYELDRVIYDFDEETKRSEDKLLLVKEEVNNTVQWKPLVKGWEYSLWYSIGERGGLAEAEELLVQVDGNIQAITIEDYVAIYKKSLKNPIPAKTIFDDFSIYVEGWRKKVIKRNYVIDMIENDYGLVPVHEDEDVIYYKKEIKTVEELAKMPVDWKDSEAEITMSFEKISE